ncbi:MAG: zinc ribbon domain-containing protein [Anaerolineales bacterium]|nr:zinc ribbon domain-containing protein [Anaerolineales bacterium]
MPLYEFVCSDCGSSFEYLVRSSASQELILCPKCESGQVSKKFSTFGMKGSAGGGSVSSGDNCSTGGG